jgi:hypothetical protein
MDGIHQLRLRLGTYINCGAAATRSSDEIRGEVGDQKVRRTQLEAIRFVIGHCLNGWFKQAHQIAELNEKGLVDLVPISTAVSVS